MKKSILTSLTALAISTAQAGFIIKIPLEQTQGGALPDGSINITHRTPGLPVENWQPAEPLYGEWVNVNDIYGCSNWTPATSTQPIGVIFQQTADDCKQDQTTTKQEREKETTTLAYRNLGQPTTETKSIVTYSSRQATGTKETWVTTTPTYTEWINVGESYDCLNISLDASSSTTGRNFVQRETGCKQAQNRTRQDREQETTTLVLRDIGEPVLEDRLTNNANAQKTTNLLLPANCYFEAFTNNTFVRQYHDEPFEARYYQTTFYMDFWGQSMFTSGQGEFLTATPKMSDSKIYSRGPLVRTAIYLRDTAKSGMMLYSICRN